MLLLCSFILLGLTSCSSVLNHYACSDERHFEFSSEEGHVSSLVSLAINEHYFFLHGIFQSILPKLYENYNIEIGNIYPFRNEEDIIRYMYIDECRILLPTGKVIDLLDKNITLHYVYYATEEVTGIPYKILRNVKPQYINNKKIVYMNGVANGDSARVIFNADIPSSVNSLLMEYTLTIIWEKRGAVKEHYTGRFKKGKDRFYWFSV